MNTTIKRLHNNAHKHLLEAENNIGLARSVMRETYQHGAAMPTVLSAKLESLEAECCFLRKVISGALP